ncbi:MAG: hypothetical protein ABEK02_04710 [Haloquadratum sp.]
MSHDDTHGRSDARDGSTRTRRRFLGTAAATLSVAVAGCGSALEEGAGTAGGATATVALAGAPNGLRKYRCTLKQDGRSAITAVEPGLVDGEEFQVVNGGVDSASVAVRAADLSDAVGAFETTKPLFSVTYAEPVRPSDLTLTVSVATNDSGESIPTDRVQVSVGER